MFNAWTISECRDACAVSVRHVIARYRSAFLTKRFFGTAQLASISTLVKTLFYSRGLGTGCCTGFNRVLIDLRNLCIL